MTTNDGTFIRLPRGPGPTALTVRELITLLQQHDPAARVVIALGSGRPDAKLVELFPSPAEGTVVLLHGGDVSRAPAGRV